MVGSAELTEQRFVRNLALALAAGHGRPRRLEPPCVYVDTVFGRPGSPVRHLFGLEIRVRTARPRRSGAGLWAPASVGGRVRGCKPRLREPAAHHMNDTHRMGSHQHQEPLIVLRHVIRREIVQDIAEKRAVEEVYRIADVRLVAGDR